jgi:hypothetical protein
MDSSDVMAGMTDIDVFAKMQVGEPFKRYKKTILGKVFIYYLNPFTGKIDGKILAGNPKKGDEGCFISTWSNKDDAFFKNMNRKQLESRRIVETSIPVQVEEKVRTANDMSDSELTELINAKGFFKLQNTLNKMTSPETVSRLLDVAEQAEKSDRIKGAIKARLSELDRLQSSGELER